jgi:uncharacterized membrane-anchored protein YjiN (DUF445 family)
VRAALNARLKGLLVELAARHGEDVARLVSETIRKWDSQTIVDKLEMNVGRDLQYIRLNGTDHRRPRGPRAARWGEIARAA